MRITKTTTIHLTDRNIQVGALIDALSSADRGAMLTIEETAPDRPGSVAAYSLSIREETQR